jgi:two-component system heavy metal sensor histidine kinase CusS
MRMTVLSSLRSAGGLLRALRQRVDQLTAMLERQRRSCAQREAFSANVAHELRTPLTTLIAGTELTLREGGLPPAAADRLGDHLDELRRMQGIVGDMLFLSRAYGGQRARRQAVESLAALAREVTDYHEAALEEAELSVRIEGDGTAEVDAALLKRALSNLIDNATRYATPGSALRVGIEPGRGGTVRLWVANRGPVIPAARLPRLFDRFYRAESSRGSQAHDERASGEHLGLGLSIVDAVARMHGGAPFARSDEGETRIGFTLTGGRRMPAYTPRRPEAAAHDAPASPPAAATRSPPASSR